MKKVLLVSNVIAMIYNFNQNNIKILQDLGYEVHAACNLESESFSPRYVNQKMKNELEQRGIIFHHIDFGRRYSAFFTMYKAYKQLSELMLREKFDFVHSHSHLANVVATFAARKAKIKNICTAHGFMFFKGAPLINWLVFYPQNWICSWWTDVLITINKEDYKRAKCHFHAKKTVYIPGVGVDTKKFAVCNVNRHIKRQELGLKDTDFVLLSVGELSKRKNQKIIIDALGKMEAKKYLGNIIYLAVGEGDMQEDFEKLIKQYGLKDHVKLLGYRKDIDELCEIADCFVHSSIQEGLGIAPLEAMASGLPLISADINGIKDYTQDGVSGCCIDPMDIDAMIAAIRKMQSNKTFRQRCGANNLRTVQTFDINNSIKTMHLVYSDITLPPMSGCSHLKAIIMRQKIRKELKIPIEAKLLISVGELSYRKNHKVVIEALNQINDSNTYYIIVGEGALRDELKNLDKTGRIRLLGYRKDIVNLLRTSDLFVFPSIQEGLPVALMEAISTELPCLASKIRGNTDLLDEESLISSDWVSAIRHFTEKPYVASKVQNVRKNIDIDLSIVNVKIKEVYECIA